MRINFLDPHGETPKPRVNHPYFDADNHLRWDQTLIHTQGTGSCDTLPPQLNQNGLPIYPRRVRMLHPRVDERQCAKTDGQPGTEITLIGLDTQENVKWQRPLVFRSGSHLIDQHLIGATPEGLVLSNLEVWSPWTGETLIPPRTHSVDTDARPVPDYQFSFSTIYHPQWKEFIIFDADVTLLRRKGGLYRIDPKTGRKGLLHSVSTTLLGGYDHVEGMALSRDGRYLFLAQRLTIRGPSSVSLAVFDLQTRQLVFHERHGEPHSCGDPQVVVGKDNNVGFAYRNTDTRRHVLIHYRMAPSSPSSSIVVDR